MVGSEGRANLRLSPDQHLVNIEVPRAQRIVPTASY